MAKWSDLSNQEKKEYGSRKEYRKTKGNDKKDVTTLPVPDLKGRNATHYMDHKGTGGAVKITPKNNPYTKDIKNFDTAATGAGAHKGTKRYGATDMRSHIASGKSKQEVIDYASSLGDDVKMGAAAQKLLTQYKQDIIDGKKPGPGDEVTDPTNPTDPINPTNPADPIKIIDKSNSGVKGNTLKEGAVIVNNGGQGMGGKSENNYTVNDNFEIHMDTGGAPINNSGLLNVDLGSDFNYNSFMTQSSGDKDYEDVMEDVEKMYSSGSSGALALSGNPYSSVIGDYDVQKPFTVAQSARDSATYTPLFFSAMGNAHMNNLFGSKGA